MEFILVVRHPFGDYQRGDRITEPEEIARIVEASGEHVIRVALPSDAAPST